MMVVVTLGQEYNVGEKPTVILYIDNNRHAGNTIQKPKQNKTETMQNNVQDGGSNIMFFIGCKVEASTWYLNVFPDGSNLGSTV